MTDARPRGLLLPLILVVVGVLLLLANFGYLPPVSWRTVAQLWPAILIVIGIDLVLGRRQPLVALGLEVLLIAGLLVLAFARPADLFGPAEAAGQTSATVERAGARTLALRVAGGAGSYSISGGASALVEVQSSEGQVRVTTERRGDAAEVRVEPATFGGIFPFSGPRLDVRVLVDSSVPASIRLEGGAGDFTVDLAAIQATDARIGTGASSVRIVLPRPRGDVPVRIEAGAASIEIDVPEGIEASISTSGGAVSFDSTDARLTVSSGRAATPGYGGATDRVTVTVEAGASSVTVR